MKPLVIYHDYPHKTDHIIDWCGEALAAYNKLKGE